MRDYWGDKFIEEVGEGAFDESLSQDEQKALYDHMTSIIIGATKSETLKIESDNTGLKFEVELPSNSWGNYVYNGVERGDLDGVSFGFTIKENGEKWQRVERDGEEIYKRTLLNVKLHEISITGYAAYESSEVNCRSLKGYKESLPEFKELRAIENELIESEKELILWQLDYEK